MKVYNPLYVHYICSIKNANVLREDKLHMLKHLRFAVIIICNILGSWLDMCSTSGVAKILEWRGRSKN